MKVLMVLVPLLMATCALANKVEPVDNKYLSELHKQQYGSFQLTRYWQPETDSSGYRVCSGKEGDCLDFPGFVSSLQVSVVTANGELFLLAMPFYEVGVGDIENFELSVYRWRDKQLLVSLNSSNSPEVGDFNSDGHLDVLLEGAAGEACDWGFGYPRLFTFSQYGFQQAPLRKFPAVLSQYVEKIDKDVAQLQLRSKSPEGFWTEAIGCLQRVSTHLKVIADSQP